MAFTASDVESCEHTGFGLIFDHAVFCVTMEFVCFNQKYAAENLEIARI